MSANVLMVTVIGIWEIIYGRLSIGYFFPNLNNGKDNPIRIFFGVLRK